MRTTVRLDDSLARQAKQAALDAGMTFTELLSQALREMLTRRQAAPPRQHVTLPTFRGRGLQPGVDLNDSAALLDLMEERA